MCPPGFPSCNKARATMRWSPGSLQFENEIQQRFPRVSWQVDPQWTYPLVYSRFDGLNVLRKAASGYTFDNYYGWILDKYLFETLAVKNSTFLGLALINTDATPQAMQLGQMCTQGQQHPACPRYFQGRRLWAQAVLGLQLSSFSL